MVGDLEALQLTTREALQDFASHLVVYLELRSTPKRLQQTWKSGEITTKSDYENAILSVIQDFERQEQERHKREREGGGLAHCRLPLQARLLISIGSSCRTEGNPPLTRSERIFVDGHRRNAEGRHSACCREKRPFWEVSRCLFPKF